MKQAVIQSEPHPPRDAPRRACSTAQVKTPLALLALLGLFSSGCVTEKVPEPPHTYGHVQTQKEMKKKTPLMQKPEQQDTTQTVVTQ